jgi:hypothetical protein
MHLAAHTHSTTGTRRPVVFTRHTRTLTAASQEAESAVPTPRQFSKKTSTSNMLRLKTSDGSAQRPYRVDFVLLEHFSMASFTVAMDVLVTANLLRADSFAFTPCRWAAVTGCSATWAWSWWPARWNRPTCTTSTCW